MDIGKDLQRAFDDGYVNAIDDFVKQCKENVVCNTFGFRFIDIEKIAEQLKSKTDYQSKV